MMRYSGEVVDCASRRLTCATPSNQRRTCRAIDGATPVVAPLEWYGRCDDSSGSQLPRDYSDSYLPFVDQYCVADVETGTTGVEASDYFDDEIYIANDYGGMFTIEGEDSNWAVENARPGDQNVCYVFGTINYFPSQA